MKVMAGESKVLRGKSFSSSTSSIANETEN